MNAPVRLRNVGSSVVSFDDGSGVCEVAAGGMVDVDARTAAILTRVATMRPVDEDIPAPRAEVPMILIPAGARTAPR